ncbi:diuretic hormone class 2-like [Argiope bruennichi]|uniref:Diuretic hormone class 2 like protein n=1 Tax=Argiope bruennichi TaxID=94029 RepID=A0A8T0EFK4_ARGBR|nr:diuretic hormone class 2-like [Argiope bruennichi]KAF8770198.1 Diuretic hormone class 2 like protein [Argiope bruennichi]
MLSHLCAIALFLCIVATSIDSSLSFPSNPTMSIRSKRSIDNESQEEIVRILMRLAQTVSALDSDAMMHSDKRGIDLGLSRGFSGSQAAKHLMGLAAANFANGPGRRRRDADSQ